MQVIADDADVGGSAGYGAKHKVLAYGGIHDEDSLGSGPDRHGVANAHLPHQRSGFAVGHEFGEDFQQGFMGSGDDGVSALDTFEAEGAVLAGFEVEVQNLRFQFDDHEVVGVIDALDQFGSRQV